MIIGDETATKYEEEEGEINVVINIDGTNRLEKFLNTIKPNINLGLKKSRMERNILGDLI